MSTPEIGVVLFISVLWLLFPEYLYCAMAIWYPFVLSEIPNSLPLFFFNVNDYMDLFLFSKYAYAAHCWTMNYIELRTYGILGAGVFEYGITSKPAGILSDPVFMTIFRSS